MLPIDEGAFAYPSLLAYFYDKPIIFARRYYRRHDYNDQGLNQENIRMRKEFAERITDLTDPFNSKSLGILGIILF